MNCKLLCKRFTSTVKLSYSLTNKEEFNVANKHLIFLHGLFGNKNNWRGISYSNSIKSKRNTVIVDARNHGSSEHHDSMTYFEMAHDINRLVKEELKIDKKFTLLGHSMGGKIAMTYAALFPDSIDGVFVVDAKPQDHNNNPEISDTINQAIDFISKLDLKNKTRTELLEELKNSLGPTTANLMNTNLMTENNEMHWRVNVKGIHSNIKNILGWEDCGQYSGPVRVLNGERSHRFYIEDFTKVFPAMKMKDIRMIPGAAHWIHTDKPQETIVEISRFLDEIDQNINKKRD